MNSDKIALKSLANRIVMNNKLIKKHPESKDMLEANTQRQKEYIIQCVLQNIDNPLLERIFFNLGGYDNEP